MTTEVADDRFRGQVVMVTGGAKGQGRSHALGFVDAGAAAVIICDIATQLPDMSPMGTPEDLEKTSAEIEQRGARCLALQADTRSPDDMRRVVSAGLAEFGQIDVLMANAGVASFAPFVGMPYHVWRSQVDINLSGVAHSVRAVLPGMVKRRSGAIVATSSSVGREGGPNSSAYTAAKWGVIGFIKSIALEVGELGIRINALAPMSVSTDMCHNENTYRLFRPDIANPTAEDVSATFGSLNPMLHPWLDPAEVTAAALYLASSAAAHVTGVCLDVAGGWNAQHHA